MKDIFNLLCWFPFFVMSNAVYIYLKFETDIPSSRRLTKNLFILTSAVRHRVFYLNLKIVARAQVIQ